MKDDLQCSELLLEIRGLQRSMDFAGRKESTVSFCFPKGAFLQSRRGK